MHSNRETGFSYGLCATAVHFTTMVNIEYVYTSVRSLKWAKEIISCAFLAISFDDWYF